MERSSLEAAVRRALTGPDGPKAGSRLVVGLSGGADSVALTGALASLCPRFGVSVVAAHLDHGLRPTSADDAEFCRSLCQDIGIELRVGRADVRGRARREGRGLEDAARRERYAFLRDVRDREGAFAVVVAHTRDDQAETVLLRLLRGAGRRGLSAMRARRPGLLRPLLGVSRADVLGYLQSRGLPWRDDETNADRAFARNRVRHDLLPLLEGGYNPRLKEGLARTAAVLADEASYLEARAHRLWTRCGRIEGGAAVLQRSVLARGPRALARLVLRRALRLTGGLRGVSSAHVERLLGLLARKDSSGRRLPLPGGREAEVAFGELRIARARNGARAAVFALPLAVPGRVALPDGRTLVAEPASGPLPETSGPGAVSNGETAVVAVPDGPLEVRTRQPGDRVWVHGREVSLKRFLMDRRVAASKRPALPLVAAGHRVVFVPGQVVEGVCGKHFVKLSLLEGRAS